MSSNPSNPNLFEDSEEVECDESVLLEIQEKNKRDRDMYLPAIPTANGIQVLGYYKKIPESFTVRKAKAEARKEWWIGFLIEAFSASVVPGIFLIAYALFGGFSPDPVEPGTPATYEQVEDHYGIDVLNTSIERSGDMFLYLDSSKQGAERAQLCKLPTVEKMNAGEALDCEPFNS